jgi:peptidoglycan hydrolase-like protein with peptidoglycan-binding domain
MRKSLAFGVAVVAALTLVAGCDSGESSDSGAQTPGIPSSSVDPTPSATEPTTAPTAQPEPTQTPTAAPKPTKLKSGAKGAAVLALQHRLVALGYWVGKTDGNFGSATQQAVYALQKASGLGRDGVVGPKTKQALDQGVHPKARSAPGTGHLIEINLTEQLLMVVDNGQVTQVFNTSTGSNKHYEYDGGTYLADTPPGHFTVGRQIDGWRHGPLGPLWRPKYFNGGIAVHGAPSVPAYPASHGCARVSIAAMNWLWANNKIPLKAKVWVYNA